MKQALRALRFGAQEARSDSPTQGREDEACEIQRAQLHNDTALDPAAIDPCLAEDIPLDTQKQDSEPLTR